MNVSVRLFGAFRNLGPQEVTVALPKSSVSATEMKAILSTHLRAMAESASASPSTAKPSATFDAASLVEKSALANESAVLDDHAVIQAGAKLAILPPVSGG